MLYKVVSESVEIDGTEFLAGEVVELEADAFNVSELLADGSIVEASDDSDENDGEDQKDTSADEADSQSEDSGIAAEEPKHLMYNGKKVVGEVVDSEVEGKVYKNFSVEGGETFKLSEEEFNGATSLE